MGKESAKKFLSKMKEDKAFREKVLARKNEEEKSKLLKENDFDYFDMSDDEVQELMEEVEDEEAMRVVRVFYDPTLGCGW